MSVYTDPSGKKRPITPRKLGVGSLVLAVGIGVTVAFSSGGGGAAGVAPEIGAQTSVSVRAARTSRDKGERTRVRLSVRGDVDVRTQEDGDRCAASATGQVRAFLREHPCRELQRGSFAVTPGGRDRVVVAVAWITMPDASQATELRRLIDTPGTGSIRPLDRRIELTGQHYASRQEGELVTVAEAEPDGRSVPGRVLEEIADEASR
jgi:hypothetical protein